MRSLTRLIVVVALAVLAGGCSYEKMLDSKQAVRPDWVDRPSSSTGEMMTFTGMGLARNVLDERTARNQAMTDARAQIANSLMADTGARTVDVQEREGAMHLGEDEADAAYESRVESKARQAIRGARRTADYWEKWKIREGLFSMPYTRIKWWVRVDVPRDLYQDLANDLER
jgi:hypothetical protein